MKYFVSVAVDGRLDIEVEANSFEEAKERAELLDGKYDWNMLEIVSHLTAVNAEDETGKSIDY